MVEIKRSDLSPDEEIGAIRVSMINRYIADEFIDSPVYKNIGAGTGQILEYCEMYDVCPEENHLEYLGRSF